MQFSIIVPCYKATNYLDRLFKSLTSQTFSQQEFEVILVNDGSPDHTLESLHQHSQDLPHIKIIDQENTGVSGARNTGLAHATGDWVLFLDVDDWICENYLTKFDQAIKSHPDVGIFFSSIVNYYERNGKTKRYRYSEPTKLLSTDADGNKVFDLDKIDFYYRTAQRVFLNRKLLIDIDVKFSSLVKYGEDTLFHFKYLASLLHRSTFSHQAIYIPTATYYYFQARQIKERSHDQFQSNLVLEQYQLLRTTYEDFINDGFNPNHLVYSFFHLYIYVVYSLNYSKTLYAFSDQTRLQVIKVIDLLQKWLCLYQDLDVTKEFLAVCSNDKFFVRNRSIPFALFLQAVALKPSRLDFVKEYLIKEEIEEDEDPITTDEQTAEVEASKSADDQAYVKSQKKASLFKKIFYLLRRSNVRSSKAIKESKTKTESKLQSKSEITTTVNPVQVNDNSINANVKSTTDSDNKQTTKIEQGIDLEITANTNEAVTLSDADLSQIQANIITEETTKTNSVNSNAVDSNVIDISDQASSNDQVLVNNTADNSNAQNTTTLEPTDPTAETTNVVSDVITSVDANIEQKVTVDTNTPINAFVQANNTVITLSHQKPQDQTSIKPELTKGIKAYYSHLNTKFEVNDNTEVEFLYYREITYGDQDYLFIVTNTYNKFINKLDALGINRRNFVYNIPYRLLGMELGFQFLINLGTISSSQIKQLYNFIAQVRSNNLFDYRLTKSQKVLACILCGSASKYNFLLYRAKSSIVSSHIKPVDIASSNATLTTTNNVEQDTVGKEQVNLANKTNQQDQASTVNINSESTSSVSTNSASTVSIVTETISSNSGLVDQTSNENLATANTNNYIDKANTTDKENTVETGSSVSVINTDNVDTTNSNTNSNVNTDSSQTLVTGKEQFIANSQLDLLKFIASLLGKNKEVTYHDYQVSILNTFDLGFPVDLARYHSICLVNPQYLTDFTTLYPNLESTNPQNLQQHVETLVEDDYCEDNMNDYIGLDDLKTLNVVDSELETKISEQDLTFSLDDIHTPVRFESNYNELTDYRTLNKLFRSHKIRGITPFNYNHSYTPWDIDNLVNKGKGLGKISHLINYYLKFNQTNSIICCLSELVNRQFCCLELFTRRFAMFDMLVVVDCKVSPYILSLLTSYPNLHLVYPDVEIYHNFLTNLLQSCANKKELAEGKIRSTLFVKNIEVWRLILRGFVVVGEK